MEACRSNTSDVLSNGEVVVRVAEASTSLAAATTRTLKLLVEIKAKLPSPSKELLVRLTDDHDPFVLYTCVVREDDYCNLRQTQGLLVDFNAFPYKFVELINSCNNEQVKDSPRFILVLRCSNESEGSATLEVVEVNVFKHLCHLALALVPAPTQLKLSYLADCCKALKAQGAAKEREAAEREQQLRQQLSHTQQILAKTSEEVHQLQNAMSQHVATSTEKQAQLISQEKEKLLKVQSDADRKTERMRRELEARKNTQIEQLQAKLGSLTSQNNDLSERKHQAESNAKELQRRLNSAEENLHRCRQELNHIKKQNAHLEQENHTKSATVRELESTVSHLEADLRSQGTHLAHLQQMAESLQQQKGSLEETVEERRQKLIKRENSIQLLYAELQKSLDVIKKLQKRVKEEHMTSKVRGAALMEQDKVVAEKDSSVSQLNEQLQLMTTKVSQLTIDRESLQQQLHEAKEKLQEQEKTLQTNENVISWLNKQLNEVEVTGAMAKRAPLSEAYLASQGPSTHAIRQQGSRFTSGGPSGLVAHSTPVSNTLKSFPTASGGWLGQTTPNLSSFRNFGNIPPIPEVISPRTSHDALTGKNQSPADKENMEGLDPKYFEATNPASVPVQGLLRANYCGRSPPDSDPMELNKNTRALDKRGGAAGTKRGGSNRGARGGGRPSARESRESESQRKPRASSYFPKS